MVGSDWRSPAAAFSYEPRNARIRLGDYRLVERAVEGPHFDGHGCPSLSRGAVDNPSILPLRGSGGCRASAAGYGAGDEERQATMHPPADDRCSQMPGAEIDGMPLGGSVSPGGFEDGR
jgi:hypothetical protein